MSALDNLVCEIEACRICRSSPQPRASPLPHEPRPVLRVSATARICVCGQAPGNRVHASGVPFSDPSGIRLRSWMGVSEAEFYDARRIAIVPMGFCFPGLDAKGGDLPPRRECAPQWRDRLFAALPRFDLLLLIGKYAIDWHLQGGRNRNLTSTVENWRAHWEQPGRPRIVPLPHPSWRNNAWIKRNAWFEDELLPELRAEIRRVLDLAPRENRET